MSTDTGSTPADSRLRDRFPEVIISRSGKHDKVLHVPNDDGEEPLCGSAIISKGWRRKSVAVYPPGHFEWCDRCKDKLREQDCHEPRRGPTEPSRTVKQWEKKYGSIWNADW